LATIGLQYCGLYNMLLRALLIWLTLLIIEGALVILMAPPTLVVNAAQAEEALIAATLNDETADVITGKAKGTFDSLFVDSGVMAESFHLFLPNEEAKRKSVGLETLAEGLFDVVRRRLESFWNLVFVGLQRFYGFAMWLPMLIPFVVAAAFDGATVRRIKLLTFGMSSAAVYGGAMHGLVILIFVPLYYACWPFSVTPMLVPFWFIALAMVIKHLVANLQRV
jgi:hypothetical protein